MQYKNREAGALAYPDHLPARSQCRVFAVASFPRLGASAGRRRESAHHLLWSGEEPRREASAAGSPAGAVRTLQHAYPEAEAGLGLAPHAVPPAGAREGHQRKGSCRRQLSLQHNPSHATTLPGRHPFRQHRWRRMSARNPKRSLAVSRRRLTLRREDANARRGSRCRSRARDAAASGTYRGVRRFVGMHELEAGPMCVERVCRLSLWEHIGGDAIKYPCRGTA